MRMEPGENSIALNIVHDRNNCSDCRAAGKSCHLADLYPNQEISDGTVIKGIATCPKCGVPTTKGFLGQEAQAGRMGHRLYCIIYRDSWRDRNKNGSERKRETTCRVFATPEERHLANNVQVASQLARLQQQWASDDVLPTEAVPVGNDQVPHLYGMEMWIKMFNPRQQLVHGYCVQAFRESVDADADAGRLNDRRRAAWGYVALALDKIIDANSLSSIWHPNREVVAHTFARHDFGFKWSYAEMAVTCRGLGLEWSIKQIADCMSAMIGMTGHHKDGGKILNAYRILPQFLSRPKSSGATPATCLMTTLQWTASSSTLPTKPTSTTRSCPTSSMFGSSAPPATFSPMTSPST